MMAPEINKRKPRFVGTAADSIIFIYGIIEKCLGICYTVFKFTPGGVYDGIN